MKTYSLTDEFINGDLERGILAAIHKDHRIYWDLLDSLSSGTFARERETWEALSAAIHAEKTTSLPVTGRLLQIQ